MSEYIEFLLQALAEGDEAERIEAAQGLAFLEDSSEKIVRALERAVVSDPSQEVQEAALTTLSMPVHHRIHSILTFTHHESRRLFLRHIDQWAADGLISPQVTALLKGRYTPEPPSKPPPSPPQPAAVMPPKPAVSTSPIKEQEEEKPFEEEIPAEPIEVVEQLPSPPQPEAVMPSKPAMPESSTRRWEVSFDGEIAAEGAEFAEEPIEEPLLEKQKSSLAGALLSEITIKIELYLGAFLIVAAAVVFAGLVEPARFPMLTLVILGFLTAAVVSIERIPLGSFALFVIGTLLIPIDAVVFSELINLDASPPYWAVIVAGMSLVYAGGTYLYRSRLFSLMIFATFSIAVYLVAIPLLTIESDGFLLVVSLVALAGLGEAAFLRRWQGDSFFEPMFAIAQLQALGILGILGINLLAQLTNLLARIVDEGDLSAFDSQEAARLGAWLTLGVFYFVSDQLTQKWKKWKIHEFPILVIACLMTPPIFIMEAISADPHQIAVVLWGWGVLVVIAAEVLEIPPIRWIRTYAFIFLYTSILFLAAAPLVEYITTREYAVGYCLATSLVYFVLTYRRKESTLWSVALLAAYLAFLVGIEVLREDASPVFTGFALLIPALAFLSVELVGRRYFQAVLSWTVPPLLLGLFNTVWDVGILLSWYSDHAGSAAMIFLAYGIFGALYAVMDKQPERGQAKVAWTTGLIAAYGAYIYILPNVNQIDFGGYMLLVPALVFLSAELVGKSYFRLGQSWTLPLLNLGLFNVALDVWATLAGGLDSYPGSAAIIFLIYGIFGVVYAGLNGRSERNYTITAWVAGLVALYAAYMFVYRLQAIGADRDIFLGYALLVPALAFLSAELIGKLYFRASQAWTLPLFGLGLFNAVLVVPVTLIGGLTDSPGSAAIIFLIYGVFGVLYAALESEHNYAVTAWTVGLIALYTAYGFVYRLPGIEDLDIFPGYALLIPTLVFLSAELIGKLYFRASQAWTLPLFGLGLFNAVLVVPVTLIGGLTDSPGSAAIIFLIYGVFGVLYAALESEHSYAVIAWTVGLIALYATYGFVYRLPAIEDLEIFPGYALLIPTLVFLSAELAGKFYFRVSQAWTLPLFGLGLFNATLVIPVAFNGGLNHSFGSAAMIFLIGGLFAVSYAALDRRSERNHAVTAWTVGLIALYIAYGFFYYVLVIDTSPDDPGNYREAMFSPASAEDYYNRGNIHAEKGNYGLAISGYNRAIELDPDFTGAYYNRANAYYRQSDYAQAAANYFGIFPGFVLLVPALAFLSAELVGKLYYQISRSWTLPLLGLGILNALVVVPVTIEDGLTGSPGSAAIIFLIYGLFGVLYAALDRRSEHNYAVTAWTVGLAALYAAYMFVYRLQAVGADRDIFLGYALLVPALAFLSAELIGKLYFRARQDWTLPLLGLGLLNAVLVVPVALDGGLDSYPGSAAIIFLIYGLFGVLYIVLNARTELGYMATGSLVPALAFALVFYDQDHWVIPFVALTLVYYLGGLTLNYFYHQRDWWQVLHWSGLALGTATAFSAPVQGGGDAVVGMGVIATLYGAEAFRLRNVWVGLPANGLFLGAYLMALQELNVTEPQLYSIGMGLLAIVTHYLLTRRSEQRAAFVIGFAMGVTAQMILLGTSFIQMSIGLQFFFILFFQSLILLGYGLVIRSLSFTIIPILFVVGGVLRVVFTALAHYSTVVTLGCTGLGLVLLGITALVMRERLLTTYEEFQQSEKRSSSTMNNVLDRIRLVVESLTGLRL